MPTSAIGTASEANRHATSGLAGTKSAWRSAQQGFGPLWRSAQQGFTPLWRSAQQDFAYSWRSAQQGFAYSWRSAQQGFAYSWRSAQQGFTYSWRSAQQGFTYSWRSAQQGFTLVELLIVLFIIALMSVAVLAAWPDSGALEVEAEQFAARTAAAKERAVMDNRPIAIRVDQGGYAFEWREAGQWRTMDAGPFTPRKWGESTRLESAEGRIQFDSTGFAEPAQFVLQRGNSRITVAISDGGSVHVRS